MTPDPAAVTSGGFGGAHGSFMSYRNTVVARSAVAKMPKT
jgi:hypothetical protein